MMRIQRLNGLGAALGAAWLASCGGGGAGVDVDEVPRHEMVVLGRVLLYYQGEQVSGRTTLFAAGPTEERIDAERHHLSDDGGVVWKMKRPYGEVRLRWVRVTTQRESSVLELGENAPLLRPPGKHHDVCYFGTMVLVLGEDIPDEVADYDFVERSRVIHIALEDRADETLSQLAASHPSIRGEQYYHVLRDAMAGVPRGQ